MPSENIEQDTGSGFYSLSQDAQDLITIIASSAMEGIHFDSESVERFTYENTILKDELPVILQELKKLKVLPVDKEENHAR